MLLPTSTYERDHLGHLSIWSSTSHPCAGPTFLCSHFYSAMFKFKSPLNKTTTVRFTTPTIFKQSGFMKIQGDASRGMVPPNGPNVQRPRAQSFVQRIPPTTPHEFVARIQTSQSPSVHRLFLRWCNIVYSFVHILCTMQSHPQRTSAHACTYHSSTNLSLQFKTNQSAPHPP